MHGLRPMVRKLSPEKNGIRTGGADYNCPKIMTYSIKMDRSSDRSAT